MITKKATLESTLIELQDEYIIKHAKKLSKRKQLLMDGMTASESVIAAVAPIIGGETTLLSSDDISTAIENMKDNPETVETVDGNNKKKQKPTKWR